MWCQFVVFYMTTCGLLLLISYVKSYWWSFFPFDKFSKFEFIQNGKTQINSFYLLATDSKTRTKIRMHSCGMRTTHSYGRGACMAGGHAWQGACMAGGVYGKRVCMERGGDVCKGAFMAGGHAWQGGCVWEEGHAWWGDMCGRGVCMAEGCTWQGGMHGRGACMAERECMTGGHVGHTCPPATPPPL